MQHHGSSAPLDLGTSSSEAMLHVSAGIFATMLAVTLGVTLLGVQFRSQSYTMSGMLEYMRDKVVYGFIIVFITGTIMCVALAGNPSVDPGWSASYGLVGMFFALCYHAAYIFHLVYKLQLSQILSDNDRKMTKYLGFAEGRNRLYTRFEIWEGIMERVAETGNRGIFERGMKSVFEIMRDHRCITDPETFEKIAEYAKNVCRSCMDRAQYRFVDIYVEELLKTHYILSRTRDTNIEWATEAMDAIMGELEGIMHRAIDDDEDGACGDYIKWMLESLWVGMRNRHNQDQIDVICDCLENVVKYGILKDSGIAEYFALMVWEESRLVSGPRNILVSDFTEIRTASRWYNQIFRIMKRVSLKMVSDGEQFAFMGTMLVMMSLCNRYEKLAMSLKPEDIGIRLEMICMFSNFVSEVMNVSMTLNQHSIILAFKKVLEDYMEEMTRSNYKGESGRVWRGALWVTFGTIMSRAAYTDDEAVLSPMVVRTRILDHVLDHCERDEAEGIIDADIRYMGNALDSAFGKFNTGAASVLLDLHRRMEEMLLGRGEDALAGRYEKARETAVNPHAFGSRPGIDRGNYHS